MEEERLVMSGFREEEDDQESSLRPKTLREYVGQQAVKDSLAAVEQLLEPYDTQIATDVGYSKSDTLNSEMGIILAVAAVVIIVVLLLTSRSYAEVPVLLITFVAAALLNKGTNFIFG